MEIIECRTPLVKGGLYSPHTMHFLLVDYNPQHKPTLERLGQNLSTFSQFLDRTTDAFYGSEDRNPATNSITRQYREYSAYTAHFNGEIEVP